MRIQLEPQAGDTMATTAHSSTPVGDMQYGDALPTSRKAFAEGPHDINVPVREIVLSGGELPLRVYVSSGPLGLLVRAGLPALPE